jgi:hypothetical protein
MFDDAPGVFGDLGIDNVGPGGLPGCNRAVGVLLDKTRVTRDISGKDSR